MYNLVENIITIKHKAGQKTLQAVEALVFNIRQYSPKLNIQLLNGISDNVDSIYAWETIDNYVEQDKLNALKAYDLGLTMYIIQNFGKYNHCQTFSDARIEFKKEFPDKTFTLDTVVDSDVIRAEFVKLSEAVFKKTLTKVSDTETTLHLFTIGNIVENMQKVTLFREECTYELEYKSDTEHMKLTFDVHGKVDTITNMKEVVTP